jgi:hypothetical protein
MERQNMTIKHTTKIIKILEERNDWLSIRQLSHLSGLTEPNLRNIMRQKDLIYLERGIFDTKQPTGGRFVRVFRIPRSAKPSVDALDLARKHTGMFGQLFWASNKQVKVEE